MPAAALVRARLYDADGRDRDVELADAMTRPLKPRQLLWIDVEGRDERALAGIAAAVGLDERMPQRLAVQQARADLTQYPDSIHLSLVAIESDDLVAHGIDILAGRNWVVTVHDGPVRTFERLDQETEGETRLGALDASGFVAGIVDEVIGGYFKVVEATEGEIDRLDEVALRRRPTEDVLVAIVRLRRRIGEIRRTLAPHRTAFAALARPEMELHEELGKPWPGLTDRLDRALDAVEGLRDLLLGTFDIHMGRAAQNANDVMKVLTLFSAVLLPAVVLAGVMGMNFKLDFFESPDHFWFVIAAMLAFSAAILAGARWRGWF